MFMTTSPYAGGVKMPLISARKNIVNFIILLGLLLLSLGCSKGTGVSPVGPDTLMPVNDGITDIPDAIRTSQFSYEGPIGIYKLKINPGIPSAELIPLRSAFDLGDSYQIDVINYFAVTPCSDCVRIKAVELESDNTLTLHIAVRHPFRLPADVDHPKDNERLDLHIFDVEGILIDNGSTQFDWTRSDLNGDGLREEPIISSSGILKDPDGYTSIHDSFYDAILPTDANIHPYKIFAMDPSEGSYNPDLDPNNGYPYLGTATGHNILPQGSPEYVVEYNLKLASASEMDFLFVLSASWGQSAKGRGSELGKRNNPRYFLPEYNRKEPWKVSVSVTENTLSGNTPSTHAKITVKVMDWQQNATVLGSFDFLTSPLDRIRRQSNIRETTIEIPDMGIWFDDTNLPAPTGSGTSTNPLTYTVTIFNTALVPGGTYHGLVASRDDLEGQNLEMGLERDGKTKFKIMDFTTYQVFEINIMSADNPPTACMTTNPSPPQLPENAQPILFNGSCSTDDGVITSYEWDFDYSGNPADFHADRTGVNILYTYPRPGFFIAAIRVTDNHVPPQQSVTSVPVSVFCTTYPSPSCTITQNPSWIVTSDNTAWTEMDGKIDMGFLSNGNVVVEDNGILGYSPASPSGNTTFTPFLAGYPGCNIGSIDVDSRDRIIWVEYFGPVSVIIGGVKIRNENMDNRIHVFDTSTNSEIASVLLSQFGSYIQAVDTDQNDDIWVLFNNSNIVRLRGSDYSIVETNAYNLDEISGQEIGDVFDMAINFHNDCFYILSNSSNKGALWRFDCDMSYLSTINGNPNPLIDVFTMIGGFDLIEIFGDDALADIEIDNFTGSGYDTVLTGQQDCQIVMLACGLTATTQIFTSKTIANSDLGVVSRDSPFEGYGTHAIGIKPDGSNLLFSIVYGNDPYLPPGCSDKEMDVYSAPPGWM